MLCKTLESTDVLVVFSPVVNSLVTVSLVSVLLSVCLPSFV